MLDAFLDLAYGCHGREEFVSSGLYVSSSRSWRTLSCWLPDFPCMPCCSGVIYFFFNKKRCPKHNFALYCAVRRIAQAWQAGQAFFLFSFRFYFFFDGRLLIGEILYCKKLYLTQYKKMSIIKMGISCVFF